jgi:hypothetical protein
LRGIRREAKDRATFVVVGMRTRSAATPDPARTTGHEVFAVTANELIADFRQGLGQIVRRDLGRTVDRRDDEVHDPGGLVTHLVRLKSPAAAV